MAISIGIGVFNMKSVRFLFILFSSSVIVYFLWHDICLGLIVKNILYFIQDSEGGLTAAAVKIISTSAKIDIILSPLLKVIILTTGLLLMYRIIFNNGKAINE